MNKIEGEIKFKKITVNIRCPRCLGRGSVTWWDSEGSHEGSCVDCSGAKIVPRTIEVAEEPNA